MVNDSWSRNEGLFVKVKVENENIAMLVDTGANVTLLSEKVVKKLQESSTIDIKPVNINLITATGESAPF